MRGHCADSGVWNQEITIPAGVRILVHAPSGKGKTTLLSALYGLRRDYQGQISFAASDVRQWTPRTWSRVRQTQLSYMFQDLQLFPDLTASQNIELKNRLTAWKNQLQIDRMFEALGIADCRSVPCSCLSLGQKQRIAIIRALCQPFLFLLLDEPYSHLDQENRRQAAALIHQECEQQKAGFIMTSLAGEADMAYSMKLQL